MLVITSSFALAEEAKNSVNFDSYNQAETARNFNNWALQGLYFGPDEPAGKENHWVRTMPDKGWFAVVRMYGPEKAIFDGTYRLPDMERTE